jgi:hypothetical protein
MTSILKQHPEREATRTIIYVAPNTQNREDLHDGNPAAVQQRRHAACHMRPRRAENLSLASWFGIQDELWRPHGTFVIITILCWRLFK